MNGRRIFLIVCLAAALFVLLAAGAERASMLALIILGMLVLYAWGSSLFAMRRCRIERHIEESHVMAGEKATINLILSRSAFLPLPWLLIRDQWTHLSTGQTYSAARLLFPWFQNQASCSYTIHGLNRGIYRFERVEAITGDLFGLADTRKYSAESALLTVYPAPAFIPLRQSPVFTDADSPAGLAPPSGEGWTGMVRDYELGDPLNRIHWKATARSGTLKTRESEASRTGRLAIFLDRHPDGTEPGQLNLVWERRVSLAAGLIKEAGRTGREAGLFVGGPDAGPLFPEANDPARIYEQLATLESGTGYVLADDLLFHGLSLRGELHIYVITSRIDERLVHSIKQVRSNRRRLSLLYVPSLDASGSRSWIPALRVLGCEVLQDVQAVRAEGEGSADEWITVCFDGA